MAPCALVLLAAGLGPANAQAPERPQGQPATQGQLEAPPSQPPAAPGLLPAIPPTSPIGEGAATSPQPGVPFSESFAQPAPVSREPRDCRPWHGELEPLPKVDDPDLVRARWAQLRAQDLRNHAQALEARDRAGAHRVWQHVDCIQPGDPKVNAAIARTLPVRSHRPGLALVERRSQPVPVTLEVALARLSEEVQFLPTELVTRRARPPSPAPTPVRREAAVAPVPRRAPLAEPSPPRESAPEADLPPPLPSVAPTPSEPRPRPAPTAVAPPSVAPGPATPPRAPAAPPSRQEAPVDPGPGRDTPTERGPAVSEQVPPAIPATPDPPSPPATPQPRAPAEAERAPAPSPAADPLELPDALPPAVSAGPGRALEQAQAAIRGARYEEALAIAVAARRAELPSGERAELELLAGTAAIALGRDDEALDSFGRAIEADPERQLDPRVTSPKVLRAYEAARAIR